MVAEDQNKTGNMQFPYRIADRYHCKGFLGSGGSGLVFKAWDDLLQRMVAIKFIRNPSFIAQQRLVAEARALAKVNHPSICSIYDIGEPVDEHSSLFMVMELIEGAPLAELAGQISTENAIKMIQKLAEGVSELHAVGLVHNDINPGNVIIKIKQDEEPLPTLIDLSIARRASNSGVKVGAGVTPLFAAPEQRSGQTIKANSLEKVDIYSIGALLFFLITGQAPAERPELQLKDNHDRCSRPLRRFILRCIARDPDKRFKSVAEVAQLLTQLLYQKSYWRPVAAIATVFLASAVVIFTMLSTNSDSLGSGSTDTYNREALINQASMHGLYAAQLHADNKILEARKQAQKSVQYYRQAITTNSQTIRPTVQLVDFLIKYKHLFNNSELSALLLDTVSQAEQLNADNDNHQLEYAVAQLYYQLAHMHSDQENLSQRWAGRALTEIREALKMRPDSPRYLALHCKVQQQLNQPNAGTC